MKYQKLRIERKKEQTLRDYMKYYSKKVGNISCAAHGFLSSYNKTGRMDTMTED